MKTISLCDNFMKINDFIYRIYWLLSTQFGIDLLKMIRSIIGLPRYLDNLMKFRTQYTGCIKIKPCLHDWYEESGFINNEYFWQDILVAKMIFISKPERHVDIGSRVDGFVTHVACFREIEVFDIRPITKQIPGVIFRQVDFMGSIEEIINGEYCDSLSCLHALEHFGLGRYGDAIDSFGFERGLSNMAYLLKTNGTFYLSIPIGIDCVEFNANRVFKSKTIIDLCKKNSLMISSLKVIYKDGTIKTIIPDENELSKLDMQKYVLGIFLFKKI